jgi:hypothetical protein
MLKKIVLGTLFVGLIGVLVAGAAVRTLDRTERVVEAQGYGHGNDHDEVGDCVEGESGQGHGHGNGEVSEGEAGGSGQGRGGYGGQGREDAPGNQTSAGQGREDAPGNQTGAGQGREDAPGDQTVAGQANVEGWLTIQGIVVSVDANALIVQADSGQQVTVENRAWWFAQEQGFSAQVGDQVTLVGFYEGDHFEVGRIDNATNGQTVRVRDENGRPLWAGRGRRGG